ncbi:ribonuclease P protein subunit p29 isoform X4 [Syngnathus typhle]|uniref:ribonuclease P protein subunit p29 isoform X4 n=2 Tax=Syngnathus typhle TaxID=161592 RepID=UPI002A69BAFC|nr:ribonuclease P protein subunit p29 isoform X4 [Syngnathus typhle]
MTRSSRVAHIDDVKRTVQSLQFSHTYALHVQPSRTLLRVLRLTWSPIGPKNKKEEEKEKNGTKKDAPAREEQTKNLQTPKRKYKWMRQPWTPIFPMTLKKFLALSSPHSVQQKLLKADFHGAIITVVRSKCPSYVGTTGILIQEFKHVFKMITKQDKFKEQRGSVLGCRRARLLFLPWMESVGSGVRGGRRGASAEASGRRRPGWAGGQPSSPGRAFHSSGECSIAGQRSGLHSPAEIYETDIIPKRNSVFQVEINGFISFIYGNKFEQRASERSAKKFKFSGSIDL